MILPGCHHFLCGSLGLHEFLQNISTAGGFNRSSLTGNAEAMIASWLSRQLEPCWNYACVDCLVQPCAIRTSLFESSGLSVAGDLHLFRSVRLAWHFPSFLNGHTAGECALDSRQGKFYVQLYYENLSLTSYLFCRDVTELQWRSICVRIRNEAVKV